MSGVRGVMVAFGVLAAVAALGGAACGGGSSAKTPTVSRVAATSTKSPDPTAGPAPTESEAEQSVAVSLTEWKITGPGGAAIGPLKAGEVKFDVRNDGTTLHEFVVIGSDVDPASFAIEDGKVNEETAGDSPGEADDIDPGQSAVATMRLKAGNYVFLCNVPGHYQSGMRGRFVVR